MTLWSELADGVRKVLLMQHQIDLLKSQAGEMAKKIEDHDGRLVRIETIIELARSPRLSRD